MAAAVFFAPVRGRAPPAVFFAAVFFAGAAFFPVAVFAGAAFLAVAFFAVFVTVSVPEVPSSASSPPRSSAAPASAASCCGRTPAMACAFGRVLPAGVVSCEVGSPARATARPATTSDRRCVLRAARTSCAACPARSPGRGRRCSDGATERRSDAGPTSAARTQFRRVS
ncbi:hypothetical protein CP971_34105 [Streptomyces viridifaciens]|nr:hypothetical protein CP971_34105 [Streptomyces viridifaciens]